MRSSPAPMLAARASTHASIFSAMTCVSIPRAATRPSVEKSASGPTSSCFSTAVTSSFTRAWPDTKATSIRARDRLPSARRHSAGDLSHEYLFVSVPSILYGGVGPV